MHVELTSIILTGLGATANIEKLQANALSGENIRMNIGSVLRFPRPGYVECVVTAESTSDSDAVRLGCSYTGGFNVPENTDIITGESQLRISAACTAKIFPYIKELIADVTRRLPLTSPIQLSPTLGDEEALLQQMARQSAPASTEKTQ